MVEPVERLAIPQDFQLAWVLRCSLETPQPPGRVTPTQLVTERADPSATQGETFVAQLRRPSDPPAASGCPADLAKRSLVAPYFALVDTQGRALVPGLPTDGCGRPTSPALAALSALQFRAISTVPVQRR
jgi:hypothetical protein